MTGKALLPANCAVCVFFPMSAEYCRRRAPGPGHDEFEVVHWPKVRPTDRCGDGAAVGDGTGPGVVACQDCIHWLQPDGAAVQPDHRWGLSKEWWAASGYCTRVAPSPSAEEDRRTYWKVTHAGDSCGDGQALGSTAAEAVTRAEAAPAS